MKTIVYRHLPDDGFENHFEAKEVTSGMIVKEMVLPGMAGMKPIIIRHYKLVDLDLHWLLITYTHEVLEYEQFTKVHKCAFKLLLEKGWIHR